MPNKTQFVDPHTLIRGGRIQMAERNGMIITPCEWKSVQGFHGGRALVEAANGKYGYIDPSGNLAIPCKWEKAGSFSEGLAFVRNANGVWYFIDPNGEIVITCDSGMNPDTRCGGFREGLAVVKKNNKYGFIDKTGRLVIPCIWEDASWFKEDGFATVCDDREKWGCINKEGDLVIPCEFDEEMLFSEGLAILYSEQDDKSFVIDRSGDRIIDLEDFGQVEGTCFQEGLASIEYCGFIDKQGELVIEDKWSAEWEGFSECLAPTEEGYIDQSGRVIISANPAWRNWSEFKEGLAVVEEKGKKKGYIDKRGCLVVPFIWDSACAFSEGRAKVRLADKYYFIDKQGNVLCKVKNQ